MLFSGGWGNKHANFMRVLAVCGERSGDGILKRVHAHVPFAGAVWTPTAATAAASVPCVFDGPRHLGVMGFGPEVLLKVPWAYRKLGELERWIAENDINVLLTVDSNAFTWRLQQRVRDLVKSVHVCAPSSAWAFNSRALPARRFAVDRLCTLLPFEHEYWQPSRTGQRVEFVGYFGVETVLDVLGLDVDRSLLLLPPPPPPLTNCPLLPHEYLAQAPRPTGTLPKLDDSARRQHKERLLARINAPAHKTKLVALCPGSRLGEVRSSFGLMLDAAARMQDPSIQFVVLGASTTLGHVQSPFPVLEESEYKLAVLCGADAALAVSGTIVTELLACSCPCAVVYNSGGALTKLVATYKARVKYVSLVNIMAGAQLVPEFFFVNDAALIARQLARLLDEGVSEHVHGVLDRLVVWNGPHPVRPSHMVRRVLQSVESGG